MSQTKEKLKSVLIKALRLECGPEAIPESNVAEQLGIDSIKSLEFLVWVENEFGIAIDDADLSVQLIDSLDTLASYVETKAAAPQEATL